MPAPGPDSGSSPSTKAVEKGDSVHSVFTGTFGLDPLNDRRVETPNQRFKHQDPNTGMKAPNPKLQRSDVTGRIGIWRLGFLWCLVFGVWCLNLWLLELGFWSFHLFWKAHKTPSLRTTMTPSMMAGVV